MSDMNLIPDEFRKGLLLRRHLTLFIVTLVMLLTMVAVVRATLGYLVWRERTQVVSLEQRQQALVTNQGKTDLLRQQRQVTEQQLAALDQLRGRDRVKQFLRSIDDAYGEHIWLDGVHFQRREYPGAALNSVGSGAAAVPEAQPAVTGSQLLQGAEITGHATSHSELATFMQRLGAQPPVTDLRLINTATRSYTDVQVIDFKLALQMRATERP
jgi:Fimbrial assembly protein (PilN)